MTKLITYFSLFLSLPFNWQGQAIGAVKGYYYDNFALLFVSSLCYTSIPILTLF